MDWKIFYEEDTPQWRTYLDSLYPYFNVCKDKSVLEIGPYIGVQTQVIKANDPRQLTLVEPNLDGVIALQYHFHDAEIVNDDIFFYLADTHKFDVVVCFGLLYHLHSPLYLLELIANRVSPDHMIIETFTQTNPTFKIENDNTPGARQLINDWKSVNLTLYISKEIIISSMHNLGYKLLEYNTILQKPNIPHSPDFFIFEKL